MMMLAVRFGILVLFFSSAFSKNKHRGCFADNEPVSHLKVLRRSFRHPEHHKYQLKSVQHESCSDFKKRIYSHDLANRSLAPWTLREKTNDNLIPSVYKEAECLCKGCIINGKENTDYVSVPVVKNFMFLEKEVCSTNRTHYSLKVVYKDLPVACTCAVPRQ